MADETTTETTEEETPSEETTEEKPESTEETKVTPEDDWKAKARKHERAAKKAQKDLEAAQAALKDREQADMSEQEKALEKARQEAAEEARTEAQKELRTERLSAAIARQAAGKFADVDDAIALLDTDDDIFDDEGKVNTEALGDALEDLLKRKPHLAATPGRPSGSADGGKGDTPSGVEDMSPDDHFKAISGKK